MRIEYSPRFLRLYKKLPKAVKDLAEKKEEIFIANPFNNRLRTHKLSGRLQKYWAFWLDYRYRIAFSFVKKGVVRFYAIGDHSIYN